jgi:hypothetical protein
MTAVAIAAAAIVVAVVVARPSAPVRTETSPDPATTMLASSEHPALVSWGRRAAPTSAVEVLAGADAAERLDTTSPGVVVFRLVDRIPRR